MARNRVTKVRSMTTDRHTERGPVERELVSREVSGDEGFMPKTGTSNKDRKVRLDRDVHEAFHAVSTLSTPSKKKSKKTFPANALQKRMQSGDI